jgi:predicted amidohydrolase
LFRIAVIQMNSTLDVASNLAQAHALILEAVERQADLVVLPEMFVSLGDPPEGVSSDSALARAQLPTDYWVETLQEWAIEHEIYLVGGSLPIRASEKSKKAFNRSYVFDPEGNELGAYDKIHLFDAKPVGPNGVPSTYEESKEFSPGDLPFIFETPVGKLGIAVCYDLRFPELFKWYAKQGVLGVVLPSAFTAKTGSMHWDVLTRARAIENGIYLFAANQWGIHSQVAGHVRESYGYSRVVDPMGRVLSERPKGIGIAFADLDPVRVEAAQEQIPTGLNSRFEILLPTKKSVKTTHSRSAKKGLKKPGK